jgi:hypothetical protein
MPRIALAVLLASIAVAGVGARQDTLNRGQTIDGCAQALPVLAEFCQTVGTLLQRSATGFGASTARQALTPLTVEDRLPADPSRLALLPLLRWDPRANGFQTSLPSGSCWLEGSTGSVMRCAFDFAANEPGASARYEELRAVLHQLAPAEWSHTVSPRSVLFSDGRVVRASLHRANFAALDWVAETPDARWRVLLSFGQLGRHDEVPAQAWVAP